MIQSIFPVLSAVQIKAFKEGANQQSRLLKKYDLFNTFEARPNFEKLTDPESSREWSLVTKEGASGKHEGGAVVPCTNPKDFDNFAPGIIYEANNYKFYSLFKLSGNQRKVNGTKTYYFGVVESPEGDFSKFAGEITPLKNIVFGKAVRAANSRKNSNKGLAFVASDNGKPTTTRQAVIKARNYTNSLIQDIDALEARLRKLDSHVNLDSLRDLAVVGARRHNAHLLSLHNAKTKKDKQKKIEEEANTIIKNISPDILAVLKKQLGL